VVRSAIDVHNRVGMMRIGQPVELEIIRGGKNMLIQTTIQLMEIVTIDGSEISHRLAGASIGEIKESDIRKGLRQYLKVMDVEPNSQAWHTGVRKDDIIYSINRQLAETFESAYAAARSSRNLLLNIHRGNQSMFLLIK